MLGRWISTAEVATFTGVAEKTLCNWRCLGTGPAYSKVGRLIRYWDADVNEFFASHMHGDKPGTHALVNGDPA